MPIFNVSLSRKKIKKELSKCQKLNYNQFRWWRWYEAKNKPLHKRKPLKDKILNGDYDYSCYAWQAMLCEHMLNDLWDECFPDFQKYNEKSKLLGARRKRLWEDFDKDEIDRLTSLKKEFKDIFRITKEQVEEEMLKCSGSLIDLYYIIEKKYSVFNIPQTRRRGRPRKVI